MSHFKTEWIQACLLNIKSDPYNPDSKLYLDIGLEHKGCIHIQIPLIDIKPFYKDLSILIEYIKLSQEEYKDIDRLSVDNKLLNNHFDCIMNVERGSPFTTLILHIELSKCCIGKPTNYIITGYDDILSFCRDLTLLSKYMEVNIDDWKNN